MDELEELMIEFGILDSDEKYQEAIAAGPVAATV